MARAPGTILGGLPVIADVAFGIDGWTGEGWSEVEHIYWQKKDGTAGKEIPLHLRDKAEKYDPYFSNLTEQVGEHLAGPPDDEMFEFAEFEQ